MRNPGVVWTSVLAALLFTVFIGILYFKIHQNDSDVYIDDPTDELPPSSTKMGTFKKAAIVTNGPECAKIGLNILKKGGSAIDAIIAASLCDGVVFPQNTGLGGGFLMVYYNKAENKVYSINARESAPGAASENMYQADPKSSQKGGLAIAVPAELKGFWEIYQRFGGKVSWSELFDETISLCRKGIPVTRYLDSSLRENGPKFAKYPAITKLMTNQETKNLYKEGELMFRLKLADTMEIFQKEGGDALHNGSLTKNFLADLNSAGSIITEDDLKNYKVIIEETPVVATLPDDMTLYSVPLPGSGPIVAYILTLLKGLIPTQNKAADYVKITEALKFAYGKRSEFGDPAFVDVKEILKLMTDDENIKEVRKKINLLKTSQDPLYYGANFSAVDPHGTANMAVLAPNGDAVVITSTVNLHFGSYVVSESTGIILNDEMDDFSSPHTENYFDLAPSPANFIRPHKRPLSSMCPTIVLDKNRDVRLLVGSAGGSKITSATAFVAMLNLWYKKTIKEALDSRRIHHQVFPMMVSYELGVVKEIVEALKNAGHKLHRLTDSSHFGTSATAIAKNGDVITVSYDPRRTGGFDGF